MRKNRKQITALALALGMTATGMTGFEALAAEGETRVSQICHIDRGYEDLARDLRALGADAVRVEETENG